jgi:hypothetical protein
LAKSAHGKFFWKYLRRHFVHCTPTNHLLSGRLLWHGIATTTTVTATTTTTTQQEFYNKSFFLTRDEEKQNGKNKYLKGILFKAEMWVKNCGVF